MRSSKSVSLIIKRHIHRCGKNPTETQTNKQKVKQAFRLSKTNKYAHTSFKPGYVKTAPTLPAVCLCISVQVRCKKAAVNFLFNKM